ncbi:cytochrome b [Massilia sp. TS11]|uniref:cytochrome b n=1 Tax=Massilia sp. TS11 TaxID=2908003 RepID=UPI001EDB6205|nr:cytochrome b [Massilia sp. TS11]MCG2586691.1 cytochrome b [Massilia sp. TS11]
MRYTLPAIVLHWLIAILIVIAFIVGLTMADMPLSPTRLKLFNYHKWLGVCILGLVAARLLWRLAHRPPAYPASMSPLLQKLAHGGHHLLYLLMFAVPLSGYFYTLAAGFPVVLFGVLPLPVLIDPNPELKPLLKETHELLNWLMALVVAGHVAAAVKHRLIDKDGIMERMLPLKEKA